MLDTFDSIVDGGEDADALCISLLPELLPWLAFWNVCSLQQAALSMPSSATWGPAILALSLRKVLCVSLMLVANRQLVPCFRLGLWLLFVLSASSLTPEICVPDIVSAFGDQGLAQQIVQRNPCGRCFICNIFGAVACPEEPPACRELPIKEPWPEDVEICGGHSVQLSSLASSPCLVMQVSGGDGAGKSEVPASLGLAGCSASKMH